MMMEQLVVPDRNPVGFILQEETRWTRFCASTKFRDVSKPGNKSGNAANGAENVSFEDALKKLETIVEMMEAQDLPLETLLAKYEEGTKLAKICQTKLSEADLKIQQLEKQSSGEMTLKPVAVEDQD